MHDPSETTRRHFLRTALHGIGGVALASLLSRDALGLAGGETRIGGLASLPHFPPRAKRVICLWQGGGPSHVDLFDPKPELARFQGQDVPASVRGDTRLSTMSSGYQRWPALPAIRPFRRCGQSGTEISELLPHIGGIADDICLVRSMHTEAVNHSPGVTFFMTGAQQPGRPAMGAWLAYGLGNGCDDLPSFVVMTSSDREKSCGQLFYEHYWSNGFLPGRHQGVRFRGVGEPVPYLENPPGVSRESRRALIDDLASLNRAQPGDDPAVETRIAQYEMAFRMQASVPGLLDFANEPKSVTEMYGPDALVPGSYANNCLIARRLSERGVRFVQLMHSGWDQHGNLHDHLAVQCRDTDQASAALVKDLKQRGLLDETLVIWLGEFGRTPFGQGDADKPTGRDHFGRAYSMWMAGGGVRAGHVHGATDDFGWNIARDAVHVHDMQATVLRLCGIDHERLTYRHQGRQYRLTDVHGRAVAGLMG
ncbi:MAG: DUF1501 domain-containing protein [Planctomycetota bacterium]